jgi:tRNA1(Val) A37 N6-methylase TrmN6
MARYETPEDIAGVLAKFAPRRISRLLDPAVGGGRLIKPLLDQLVEQRSKVVCLDVDGAARRGVAQLFRPALGTNLKAETADFLEWSSAAHRRKTFDCIVMNPPFLGRKKDEIQLRIRHKGHDEVRAVSVEAAFTIRCLELLGAGGVLLSVLPASLVSGKNASWIRRLAMSYGAVKYVHELPAKAFRSLEARLYLFAFERSGKRRPTLLCNHDLKNPERIWVKASTLSQHDRWDYGFHDARLKLEIAVRANPTLRWLSVGEAVTMGRGGLSSPEGKKHGVHTCDFRAGIWQVDRAKRQQNPDLQQLRSGDLLIRRVGRACSQSAGIVLRGVRVGVTDCVLILRPKRPAEQLAILFGLRAVLGASSGPSLVEQGTGATYIAEESLRSLQIPMNVEEVYPELYDRYVVRVRAGDGNGLAEIEGELRNTLGL